MISTIGASPDRSWTAYDRPHLHLVDLGEDQPDTAAAHAQHRVRLVQHTNALAHALVRRFLERRQELVQRRVEEPDRHGKPCHGLEDALEVVLLHGEDPLERCSAPVLGVGHDHLAHHGQPVLGHEHVLRSAEPDPLRAELACLGGVLGRVGIRADAQAPQLVRPLEDRLEVLVDLRRDERNLAEHDTAGAAVDREHVALAEHVTCDRGRPRGGVERERFTARHAGLAHPPCDHGRVRGHAAVRGEDPLRVDETVDVVGRGLPADEDHRLARVAELLCSVRVEDDLAAGRAGRGVQAGGDDLDLGARIDHRVQQLVELRRVDARDGLLTGDQVLTDHVHRSLERRGCRALGRPRLQQVEPVVLDGELEVLHVAVVLLEPPRCLQELVVCGRQPVVHPRQRLGRADARDDVLALRVEQELSDHSRLAGGRIARERDARAGAVALVAEDHLDDVDSGAEIVGYLVRAPVDLRARRVPGGEHRFDRATELLARVLREGLAEVVLVDRVEGVDEPGQVVGGQVDVLRSAPLGLQLLELALEPVRVDAVDGVAVHLDQPPVGVVGEARIAGRLGQAANGHVREADVEDRVHHSRHRHGGTRADGDEQRVVRVAEALARPALEPLHVFDDLLHQPVRKVAAASHRVTAGLRRDREARRHRQAELGHLSEPDALAAEQRPAAVRRLVEVVDVSHRQGSYPIAGGILIGVHTDVDSVKLPSRGGVDFVRGQALLLP
jgi:hypothetical protein